MNDNNSSASPRFNSAATSPPRSSEIQARLDESMRRMAKSFQENEPSLTQSKYRDLLSRQGNAMDLKPDFVQENPTERLWKAAKFQVKQEHHLRCSKIIKVAQRMMGKDRGLER
ncbi:MAG: hypothetical protein IPM41_03070 [Sphingomonadales bacterium]|jgi:hypothetical protein|nr:hypothetical protein [Sphingomonadales bacterium]MBP6433654.1 hypothetical protein [Sphingorhabdus sp.]